MPLIAITVASPHKHTLEKGHIAAEVSRLSSTILRKDPKVTAVIVTIVPPEDWFCAGRSLAEANLASFWLDIHIVDGSNTKDEKATVIAAAYSSMKALIGPLHEESYVHVHDLRKFAYGSGGPTQGCPSIAARPFAQVSSAA